MDLDAVKKPIPRKQALGPQCWKWNRIGLPGGETLCLYADRWQRILQRASMCFMFHNASSIFKTQTTVIGAHGWFIQCKPSKKWPECVLPSCFITPGATPETNSLLPLALADARRATCPWRRTKSCKATNHGQLYPTVLGIIKLLFNGESDDQRKFRGRNFRVTDF